MIFTNNSQKYFLCVVNVLVRFLIVKHACIWCIEKLSCHKGKILAKWLLKGFFFAQKIIVNIKLEFIITLDSD